MVAFRLVSNSWIRTHLLGLGDLLLGLFPELGQDPLPVGEALAARETLGHLSVGDLPVVDRVLRGQVGLLDEAPGALVALFTADTFKWVDEGSISKELMRKVEKSIHRWR